MNTDQDFEDFAKRYPALMEKAQMDYIGVGKGWYNILDVLFGALSGNVTQAQYQLKYGLDHPDNKYVKPITELEANLATALAELPTIEQIKEKFGTLRFYVDRASDKHYAYIGFAEAMSGRTCEVCGAPGEARNDGWVKVLCDHHHRERQQEQDNSGLYPRRASAPKLTDE